ncbi:MAG: hypothetical protein JXR96_30640 [Deltaproteobacteria bacterium]|nr:hypothetical protein [Deltaproteobacteria bacterium]
MAEEAGSGQGILSRRAVRVTIKVLLAVFATALSTLFFGLMLPIFLLAMEILPSLGLAGVVYLAAGAVFGLLFGGLVSGISLGRSPGLVSRCTIVLIVTLVGLSIAYLVCHLSMAERFAHV